MNASRAYFFPKNPPPAPSAATALSLSAAVYPETANSPRAQRIQRHPLIAFPDNNNTWVYFEGVVSQSYVGGFAVLDLFWVAPAVVGNVVWYVAFERDNALGQNLNVDSFAPELQVISVAPPVSGLIQKATLVFNNANLDGVVAGDPFRFRVRRDGGFVFDSLVGDAQLFRVALDGM